MVNCPAADHLILNQDESISINGHIYPSKEALKSETAYDWTAKIDKNGQVIEEKTDNSWK